MSTSRRIPPPQIGALMRLAYDELLEEMVDGLASRGFDDLRPQDVILLRRLMLEGLRPTEVAGRLGLSKQAVNDRLRSFEEKGYVTLVPDPDDGRAKRVRPTERGWDLVTEASRLSAGVGRRWKRQVGAERYEVFDEVLREITGADRASR